MPVYVAVFVRRLAPIDSQFVLQRKICTAASDIFGHLVSVKKTLVAVMSLFRYD